MASTISWRGVGCSIRTSKARITTDGTAGKAARADLAFSYLILGALRGWADNGDGQVTAEEALLFAQRELRNVKGRQQTPQILGAGEVVLARNVSEKKPKQQQCAVARGQSRPTPGSGPGVRAE